jgi:exodeoxyribonuclease V alpha subunit
MTNKSDNASTIEGHVKRIVFYNPSSGWTVLRLEVDGSPIAHTVVGALQKLVPGEQIRFTGKWKIDPAHGRQFAAETCLAISPATVKGVEKYLGSGLVPGIGPKMATRLVKRFGVDTLEVLEHKPSKLAKVPGIGPKRALAIREALASKKAVRDVMVFLESAGITHTFAHRIYQRYGNNSIRVVSENPYKLASDVSGIGFRSADKIAGHIGIPENSPYRAEAGLLYTLEESAGLGNVFAHQNIVVECARTLLNIEITELENAVDRLVLMGKVRRAEKKLDAPIYLPRLYRAEEMATRSFVKLLSATSSPLSFDPATAVERAESQSGIKLAEEQRQAFFALRQAKIMVLTGGPGTGKTTLLKGLVDCLHSQKLNVAMAAPTGRAAKRVTEATGRAASTLHRLLEFTPRTRRFERNAKNPLDANVVVVDEVSMVDIELFAALLDALNPAAHLILVGDPNQLPSVGPGTVLADLLEISKSPNPQLKSVRLNRIFRQARSSLIVNGAHEILAGQKPLFGKKGESADLFMIERDEPEECLKTIKELVKTRIPSRFGFDSTTQVQVLTPMHKGLIGTTNLNVELQQLLNPGEGGISTRGGYFRVNDKVMQVKNNYDLEVFNGDIGQISAADTALEWIEVTYPERTVRYPATELDQLTLAYACSVHKSQGSEYPAVVIPIHTQHFVMLQRNLLYTAITRGKRLVVLVGSKRAVDIAIRNNKETRRNSGFVRRLRGLV